MLLILILLKFWVACQKTKHCVTLTIPRMIRVLSEKVCLRFIPTLLWYFSLCYLLSIKYRRVLQFWEWNAADSMPTYNLQILQCLFTVWSAKQGMRLRILGRPLLPYSRKRFLHLHKLISYINLKTNWHQIQLWYRY